MTSREAQLKANEYDMDLLCVAPNAQPPVCKIINYSKYRFEQQKKAKEAKKNQHVIETKEIQLTPQIGGHDMETKARAAIKFLSAGNKVKSLKDVAVVEKPATMDGRWLVAILAPVKKK